MIRTSFQKRFSDWHQNGQNSVVGQAYDGARIAPRLLRAPSALYRDAEM